MRINCETDETRLHGEVEDRQDGGLHRHAEMLLRIYPSFITRRTIRMDANGQRENLFWRGITTAWDWIDVEQAGFTSTISESTC